jgi:hypothetical protein
MKVTRKISRRSFLGSIGGGAAAAGALLTLSGCATLGYSDSDPYDPIGGGDGGRGPPRPCAGVKAAGAAVGAVAAAVVAAATATAAAMPIRPAGAAAARAFSTRVSPPDASENAKNKRKTRAVGDLIQSFTALGYSSAAVYSPSLGGESDARQRP